MRSKAKRFISLCLAVAIIATSIGYGPPAVGAEYMPYIELEEDASIATPSEAVRPDNKATPSEAVPSEEKATPSEAEKKFVRVEPEEIPEYYKKTTQSGRYFWKFEDRYGNEHYRDFGFVQGEAEFPLWYKANDKGIVEELPVSVNLDEEFYDLAPNVYESISPTKSNWSELSKRLLYDEESIFLCNRQEIIGFTNWDSSNYTIWSVGGLKEENPEEEGFNEDLGLFFYGKIRNDHDSIEQWYFADIDGNVWSMKIQPRLALAALAANFSDQIFYYDGKYSNSSTTPDHTDSFDYYTQTGESYLTLWNPGGLSGYTFLGWIVGGSSYGAGGGRDKQYPQEYPYSFVGGGFYPPSAILQWKNILPGYNGTLRGAWKPNGTYHLMLIDEPAGTIPSCGNAFSRFKYIIVRGSGETVDLSEYPSTKTGYTFDGWYTQPNGGGIRYDSVDLKSNTTLYSHFAPRLNTVRFYDSDGNLLKEEQVPSGNPASAPTEMPKKEGYMFTGWDKSFTNIISDLDITAIYEKSCILTFDTNDGTIYGQSTYDVEVLADKIINNYVDFEELKNNVNRPGYKFLGWYATPEGGSPSYGITSKISSNTTIYAKWTNISNTVTFYRNFPNGDTGTYKTKTVIYGESLGEFPEVNTVGKGLRLKGWYLDSSGTGEPVTIDYIMGDMPLKLYAQWEYFDSKLLFDYGDFPSDGWTKELSFNSSLSGDKVGKLPQYPKTADVMKSFKKPGYYNVGWYEYDLTSVDSTAWWADKEEIPVFIKWVPKSVYVTAYLNRTPTDAMVFQNNGMDSYGQTMKNIPNATSYAPTGKVFAYWTTIRDGSGEHIDFTQPLSPYDDGNSNSIIIYAYAQYANQQSTITFKDADGTVLASPKVKYGDPIPYPAVIPPAGYQFKGWDKDLGAVSNVLADTVITAQYETEIYSLTLQSNGGTYKDSGDTIKIFDFPANMEADGSVNAAMNTAKGQLENQFHTFKGWYTLPVGGIKIDAIDRLAEDRTLYAQWDRVSSEVIYKDWDGTIIDCQEVAVGGNATPPVNPNRTGYTFTGWDKESTNIQANTTITAQYSKNSYKLTLDGNGGTLAGKDTMEQQLAYGDSIDQILSEGAAEASQKYYTFAGWYTDKIGGSKYPGSGNTMPASNVMVYAHWTRTSNEVIYKDWDETILKRQEVVIGGNATPPADPSRTGYTFTGWDKESTNIQANTTITAQYSKNSYKLTLDGNGGTLAGKDTMEQQLAYGDSIDQILSEGAAEASQKYYTFAGWYTDKTGGSKYPGSGNTMPASNVMVYAHWTRTSNEVIYKDWDETILKRQEVVIGGNATPPADPSRTGYTFTGWDKESTNIQANITITAQYSKNSYKLTLDGNGGTLAGKDTREQQLAYGDSFDQILAEGGTEASQKYYTFAGWYTDKTGGSKYPGSGNTMPASNVTVYAHWTRTSNEVIYKDWDGTIIKRQDVAVGGNATPPSDPARPGYTFTGWDNSSTNIQTHTTITAQYSKNSYKLILDGNGGTLNGKNTREQQLAYGDSIDQILTEGGAEASQKYYTFAGWYTDKTGGSKYPGSGNTMPASNVTVYARWTRSSNEVVYKDWDGTIIDRQEVAIGGNATSPADPARPGYTFTGWDKPSTNIQADTTITAEYSKNSYKLTLDGNGGTLNGKDTREHQLVYGDSFDQILTEGGTEASQKYYTFAGWYTDKTGGSKYPGSGNTMPASNVTVYAHWTRTSNEVIYQDWDGTIIKRQEVAIGGNAAPPADPARPGYTFSGWDKPSTNIQTHTTITAQYSKNSYQLILDGNGGSLEGEDTREQTLFYGDSIDQILTDWAGKVRWKYYTFDGWYTEKAGGSKYPGSGNTMPASNVTVYAHWTRSSNEVIYKDWDGTIIKRQDVAIGGNAIPPTDPARPGYTFTGWDKESTNIQANTTITAQYSKNSYKLTLAGNGGSMEGSKVKEWTVTYKDSFDQILTDGKKEVSLPGYTFDGWYTSPTGGDKYTYSGNQMPALDITVYAHWKEKSYTVNFDPDHEKWKGGLIQRIYTSGTELGSLPAPEIYGWEFLGWWTGRNGTGERITENTKTGTQDVTYYGNWKIMQSIIHFDKNLSAIEKNPEDKIVTYGEVVGDLPVINAEGYTFLGWHTDPTGGEKAIETTPAPLGETTYYAHWDIVQKPTEPKPTEPQPSKPESRGKEEIIAVPAPPSIDSKAKPNVPDTGGNFIVNPDNLYDVTYTKPDGTAARDEWVGDGMDWYHVDEDGKLSYDWYLEGEKTWYKLNREPGDKFGAALIGWNYESMDDKRYFFAPSTTEMLTGWQKIDNKWYYFTKQNEAQTYYGSNRSGWHYDPTKPGKPYGSMYRNEMTPDGYLVDENGVWVN